LEAWLPSYILYEQANEAGMGRYCSVILAETAPAHEAGNWFSPQFLMFTGGGWRYFRASLFAR
jgi:hypothetical protein